VNTQIPFRKFLHTAGLIAMLCLSVGFVHAQTQDHVPQPPTSATDGKVKVHGGKFFHRNRSFAKKLGGQASSTEHPGKAFKRPKRTARLGRESKVFKGHNHFARKEKTTTAKRTRVKKP
jgi:hypothetical protein